MYSPVQARYFNELLISTFTIAGATPRYVQYVTQVHTMLVLVRSGIGIALVPASAATLHPEGVVFRSIGAFRERPVELDAVWRARQHQPRAAAPAQRRSAAAGMDHRRPGRGRGRSAGRARRTECGVIGVAMAQSGSSTLRAAASARASPVARLEEPVQVAQRQRLHRGAGLDRAAADVRQQHDVVHRQQRLRARSARRRTRRGPRRPAGRRSTRRPSASSSTTLPRAMLIR